MGAFITDTESKEQPEMIQSAAMCMGKLPWVAKDCWAARSGGMVEWIGVRSRGAEPAARARAIPDCVVLPRRPRDDSNGAAWARVDTVGRRGLRRAGGFLPRNADRF